MSCSNSGVEIEQEGNVLTIGGSNVEYGVQDTELFNARGELDDVDVIECKLPLPAGEITIKQTNPALEIYYDMGDADITEEDGKYIKEKTYNLPEADELAFILLKGEGTASIQINSVVYTINYNLN